MVMSGSLSPDPSNKPSENFLPANVNMPVLTSSDSEDEDISYEGYEVLPQDFIESNNWALGDNDSQASSSDEVNEAFISLNNDREISGFDQATQSELTDLWNSANNNRLTDIVMDSTKEEQIKNAMANFKLPATAIPPWAEHIPEEEWKERLINRVALTNKVTSV